MSETPLPITQPPKLPTSYCEPRKPWKGTILQRLIVVCVVASVAGYLALWIPWALAGFPSKNMIDGMQLISLVFLMLVGFGCGLVFTSLFWVAGLASMSLFPIISIIDIIQDPSSHNLLPLEFILYAFLTLPAIFGGALGWLYATTLGRRR